MNSPGHQQDISLSSESGETSERSFLEVFSEQPSGSDGKFQEFRNLL